MAEFKTIETQEQLDHILGERLGKEKDKWRKAEESLTTEIETLKKTITEYESQIRTNATQIAEIDEMKNSHKDEVAKLTGRIKELELQETKRKIAHDNGLPYELADRLTGDDGEALTKDAEALKGFIAPVKVMPLATTEKEPESGLDAAWKQTVQSLTQK